MKIHTLVLIVTFVVILIGIAGTILPLIPGVPLVFVAIAAYGWYEGFQAVTPKYLLVLAGFAILSLFVDYLSTTLGAKYYGSSRSGIIGALVGALLGMFIFPPLGIFIGPWAGAVVGELLSGKEWEASMRAGIGTLIGLFSGIAFKAILAIIMLVSFIIVLF